MRHVDVRMICWLDKGHWKGPLADGPYTCWSVTYNLTSATQAPPSTWQPPLTACRTALPLGPASSWTAGTPRLRFGLQPDAAAASCQLGGSGAQ